MSEKVEVEQVGLIYGLWYCLILILSLPLMAVVYILGVIGFLLRISWWAGYSQSEVFPAKRKWNNE